MNRRAFITRLAQLAVGAVAATHLPAATAPLTQQELTIAEIDSMLTEVWSDWSALPKYIVVSKKIFGELCELGEIQMFDDYFVFDGMKVQCSKYLADEQVVKMYGEPSNAFSDKAEFGLEVIKNES